MQEYLSSPYFANYLDCYEEHYNKTSYPVATGYVNEWNARYAEYEACVAGDQKPYSTCVKDFNDFEEDFVKRYSEAMDVFAKEAVQCMDAWMPDRESACDDGVDNDGDGNVDCADTDCAGEGLNKVGSGYDGNAACACMTKSYQGDPSTKLDILFIGDNVDEIGVFESSVPYTSILRRNAFYASVTETSMRRNGRFSWNVSQAMDVFRETEPLKANDAKINYWYARPNLHTGESIKDVRHRCSFADNVIVLDYHKTPFIGSHARLNSGYSVVKIYAGGDITANLAPYVALHEFGHSFAGLLDEYNIGLKGLVQRVVDIFRTRNCCSRGSAGTMEQLARSNCETQFKSMISEDKYPLIDIYRGCSYSDWYRSSEHGIMKSNFNAPAGKGKVFNEVSKHFIEEKLEAYA